MKILIIGSKGFIGTYLNSHLVKDHEVWGCDVIVDYNATNYFLVDSSSSDFAEAFQKISFDVCVNCSGAASVPDSLINPYRDYVLNTFNVFKILEAIRKYNKNCKFVNLSSAAVYGNPKEIPISENSTLNPVSPYGIHKRQAELICKEFYDFYHIRTCSLRIFSVYGPGLKKQLLWDLYQKSLNNKNEITLYGTGKESRDFIFIDDLVRALVLIILNADFKGECINIANGEEIFIENIASVFYKKLEWSGQIIFNQENRLGDPINWKADVGVLQQMNYSPVFNLEEGITIYVKWLKELK